MRVCRNCGKSADTIQHLLPKYCTEPEYYIRLPLCSQCHNFGKESSNSIGQRILNKLGHEPIGSCTTVNGLTATIIAGSAYQTNFVPIPSGTFSAFFINMMTESTKDFLLTSTGSSVTASGSAFGMNGYFGYVFLAKPIN
ncbi:MAG: hypothetical protein WC254_04805 [Candidatus Woesearchaeota archaeon]|jgi:hypothetical protein